MSSLIFTWKIDNFSFCPHKSIVSPYFGDENDNHMPWQLVLYSRNLEQSSGDFIKCELCNYPGEANTVIDFKIEIIGPRGHIIGSYEEKNVTFDDDFCVKECNLVKKSQVEQNIWEMEKDILIVRCNISYASAEVSTKFSTSVARTKIIVNHQSLRLRWAENGELRNILKNKGAYIASEYIYGPDMTEYNIVFEEKGNDAEITIFRSDCESRQCVECKISLLDSKGCEVVSIKDKYLYLKNIDTWKWASCLPLSGLKQNHNKYIRSGYVNLWWELFCYGGIECTESTSKRNLVHNSTNDIARHTLLSDIRNLFSDKALSDVTLRMNDEIVQAHKSILAARSPVFHAMFQQGMVEAQTGTVDIRDVDIETMKSFLKFLYTDTIDNMDYDCAKNVLFVAEKYEVLGLKEMCASFLMGDISEKNACEVAELADMVSHADLKSFAVDFIADHAKDILSMPEWLP